MKKKNPLMLILILGFALSGCKKEANMPVIQVKSTYVYEGVKQKGGDESGITAFRTEGGGYTLHINKPYGKVSKTKIIHPEIDCPQYRDFKLPSEKDVCPIIQVKSKTIVERIADFFGLGFS